MGILTAVDVLLALSVIVLMILVGTRRVAVRSDDEYFLASHTIGWFLLALTIAAGVMGGGILMVFSEYAYTYGLSALWIVAGIVLGLFGLLPVATRLKSIAERGECLSLPDFYRLTAGPRAGFISAVVVMVWTAGFIVMQLVSGGILLGSLTGIPYPVGVVVSAVVVMAYLLRGGIRSVIRTDTVQYSALFLLLVLVGVPASRTLSPGVLEGLPSLHIGTALGFLVLGGLNMIVSADLWIRIYAASSVTEARRGIYGAGVLILALGLLLMVPALAARALNVATPANLAFIVGISRLLPRALTGLAVAAILCAVLAALDTMVFVFALTIAGDLGVRSGVLAESRRRSVARWTMVLGLVAGVGLAWAFRELLTIGLALSSVGLALVPSVVAMMFRARKAQSAMKIPRLATELSLILGIGAVLLVPLVSSFTPETSLVALPASVVGWLVGLPIDRNREKKALFAA